VHVCVFKCVISCDQTMVDTAVQHVTLLSVCVRVCVFAHARDRESAPKKRA